MLGGGGDGGDGGGGGAVLTGGRGGAGHLAPPFPGTLAPHHVHPGANVRGKTFRASCCSPVFAQLNIR